MSAVAARPGARGLRVLRAFRQDPIGFIWDLGKRGDVAVASVGPFKIHLLNHPDLVHEVLVTGHRDFMKGQGLQEAKRILGNGLLTSEGEFHRRQRRMAQPAFHATRIAAYADVMASSAADVCEGWTDSAVVDIHAEMTRLTLSIVGKTLFDTDLQRDDAARVRDALSAALGLFDRVATPYGALLERLPVPSTLRFQRAKAELDSVIHGLIEEHRQGGSRDRGDLLSMLLMAQDDEGDGGRMTDVQLRDEAMTIFLAGHETTANALTWTWYLLSQHAEVEARLHAELRDVLGGRLPTMADGESLPYTERVITESLRLYPPAWIIGRRATADHRFDGLVIEAGSLVLVSPYLIHHDERWYPDPFRFDPDRWTPEARAERPRMSFFPFGAGGRMCIGESFAWSELTMVLATMAQRWSARLVPGHSVALQPRITLRPKHGMRMRLEARANS